MILDVGGEPDLMQCPRKCQSPLRAIMLPDVEGAHIHLCPDCEGAWYPSGTLTEVGQTSITTLEGTDLSVSLVGDKLEQIDLEADVQCPVCSQTLTRFSYSLAPDVKIDECIDHGTWLDDGELGAIVGAIAGSSADMALYRQQILDKRREMNMDGVARGGSALNPFALTLRLLNSLFTKKHG